MFELVQTKADVARAQKQLEKTVHREFRSKLVRNIGYPGGTTIDAEVWTNGTHWFYSADHRFPGHKRRLNWFGLIQDRNSLHISVEVNTAYSGHNGWIAGAFVRNQESGTTYLAHTGRIGGGTKGVGKTAFLTWSNQELVEVRTSQRSSKLMTLVMPIASHGATASAVWYVDSIAKFKNAARNGETRSAEFKRKEAIYGAFYSEGRGRRRGQWSGSIDYISRHGDVVDALQTCVPIKICLARARPRMLL